MASPLRPHPLFLGASLATPIFGAASDLPAVHLRHVPVGPLLAEVGGVDVPELVKERLGDEEGQQAFAGVRSSLDDEEHLILRLPGHRPCRGPERSSERSLRCRRRPGTPAGTPRPSAPRSVDRTHRALLQEIHVRVVVHESLGLAAVHAVAEGYLPEGRADDLVVEGGVVFQETLDLYDELRLEPRLSSGRLQAGHAFMYLLTRRSFSLSRYTPCSGSYQLSSSRRGRGGALDPRATPRTPSPDPCGSRRPRPRRPRRWDPKGHSRRSPQRLFLTNRTS